MPDTPRVTVAVFQKNQEASIAQATLAAAGIESELQGGVTADILAYLGTAIQGVQLSVAETDAERATELLGQVSDNDDAVLAAPWKCPACGERVEGSFDLCWSCGAERPEGAPPASENEPEMPAELAADDDEEDESSDGAQATPEEVVNRAWKAAILGIVFPPLLFYSFLLIALVSSSELPPQSGRRFYGSLIIVCGMFFIYWMMFRFLSVM